MGELGRREEGEGSELLAATAMSSKAGYYFDVKQPPAIPPGEYS